MGWKSTLDITRREAIIAIMEAMEKTPYDHLSNKQLEEMMDDLSIGDNPELPYYGHNFSVYDNREDIPQYCDKCYSYSKFINNKCQECK